MSRTSPSHKTHSINRAVARHGDLRDALLTVKEIAVLDGCSEKTVRRAIDAGQLLATRIGASGRLVRISKADHAAYRAVHRD